MNNRTLTDLSRIVFWFIVMVLCAGTAAVAAYRDGWEFMALMCLFAGLSLVKLVKAFRRL